MAFSFAQDLSCPCCYRPGALCDDFDPKTSAIKLNGLRNLVKSLGLGAYIVPMGDAHLSEYVSAADKRIEWLAGFTGSAATCLVTAEAALLWTDGRYFVQAAAQLAGTEWTLMKQSEPGVPTLEEWVAAQQEKLPGPVGVDPSLVSLSGAEEWEAKKCAPMRLVEQNLVDRVWGPTKPRRSASSLRLHGAGFAGESVVSKLMRVGAALKGDGCTSLVINALDQICWLFNLRGSDIDCNPVFFAYAVVRVTPASVAEAAVEALEAMACGACEEEPSGGAPHATLYIRALDKDGAGPLEVAKLKSHLQSEGCSIGGVSGGGEGGGTGGETAARVSLEAYGAFSAKVAAATTGCTDGSGGRVMLEKGTTTLAMAADIPKAKVQLVDSSPVEKFKASKNEVEIGGLVEAGRKDSAAIVSYLSWLEKQLKAGARITEADGADEVGKRRSGMSGYVGDSFETISSTGANAAVIHYKAEHGNCKVIDPKEVYLCDTGGQYVDGTTDITRTVHVGTPGEEERRAYTRVLQGHVALARAVFPAGTPGIMLEMLARGPLWRDGLNYLHGTGHGIGAFLNVHEGPFGISGGAVSADKLLASARARRMVLAPILPGYHLSNEPGFYRDGSFGIRLESDLVVEKVETKYAWGSRDFLGLKYLTLVPFCRALIETSLLAPEETEWIDAFHAKCAQELSGAELFRAAAAPSCGGDEAALSADVEAAQAWLKRETAPLVRAVGSSSSSSSRGTKRGKPGT